MARTDTSVRCSAIRGLVSEALDRELAELEAAQVERHLARCAGCASFAAAARRATALLRAAPLEEPPALWPAVQTRSRRPLVRLTAGAAAIAVAGLAGAVLGQVTAPRATSTAARISVAATQEPYVEQQLLAMLPRLRRPAGRVIAT